jgi:hypothetical protein
MAGKTGWIALLAVGVAAWKFLGSAQRTGVKYGDGRLAGTGEPARPPHAGGSTPTAWEFPHS